jgi:hypothetical protein
MGYTGIKELYVNTLALGSVETTMGALRLLGEDISAGLVLQLCYMTFKIV